MHHVQWQRAHERRGPPVRQVHSGQPPARAPPDVQDALGPALRA